jgi:hypothetical protein
MTQARLGNIKSQWREINESWQRHRVERIYAWHYGQRVPRSKMGELFDVVAQEERLHPGQHRTFLLAQSGQMLESYRLTHSAHEGVVVTFLGTTTFWLEGAEALSSIQQAVLHLVRSGVPRAELAAKLFEYEACVVEVYEMSGVLTPDVEWLDEVRPKHTKVNYQAIYRNAHASVMTAYSRLVELGRITQADDSVHVDTE